MQDSYNLAWKLALVLRGKANISLLASYDQERVPVGKEVVNRATRTLGISAPIIEALYLPRSEGKLTRNEVDWQERQLHEAVAGGRYNMNTHGTEMNQRYSSCAVLPADGSDPSPVARDPELYYAPSTVPGSHLPHAWVQQGGREISTLDLIGKNEFTLLTGTGGEAWISAAKAASDHFQIPLAVHTIGLNAEISDYYGDWEQLRDIESSGCLLVRPDGYICFREKKGSMNAHSKLMQAFSVILGKERCPALSPTDRLSMWCL